jgi:hypothetical protein
MAALYPSNYGYMHTYGALQFGGSDLELQAFPSNNGSDLVIYVRRNGVSIYCTTLAGAFTIWVPPGSPLLLSQHISLQQR